MSFPGFASTVDVNRFHLLQQRETGGRVTWLQKRLGVVEAGFGDTTFGP